MNLEFLIDGNPVQYRVPEIALASPEDAPSRAKIIWETWRRLRTSDAVVRSGYVYCGSYPQATYTPGDYVATFTDDYNLHYTGLGNNHVESVSDHTRSCKVLVELFAELYPELFTHSHQYPEYTSREVDSALRRISLLLDFHDLSESNIGDFPDDGSASREAKDELELRYMFKHTIYLPTDIRRRLLQDFVNFQHPRAVRPYSGWTPYDGSLVQFARITDKAEAPLTALKHELEGHPGDLSYKTEHYHNLTERDQFFIDLCGSSRIADTWTAHFIADYHDLFGFDQYLELLREAAFAVRGEWFPWWDNFCDVYHYKTWLD